MFADASIRTEAAEAGFDVPSRPLHGLRLRARIDEMFVFYVIAAALLAAIVIPAWQAAQVTPVIERKVEIVEMARKGDRLGHPEADTACANPAGGDAAAGCIVAIVRDGGRDPAGPLPTVEFSAAGNG